MPSKPSLWNRIKHFFKSSLNVIMIIALTGFSIWLFIYEYKLINIEAPFDFMPALGKVYEAVSASVIASIVFYYISVYIPERKQKKNIYGLMTHYLMQFKCISDEISEQISGESDITKVSIDYWRKRCKGDLRTEGPLKSLFSENLKPMTWEEFFKAVIINEDYYFEKILEYRVYLPIELQLDLEKLSNNDNFRNAYNQYCKYYGQQIAPNFDYRNISGFGNVIYNHARLLKELISKYQIEFI